MHESQADPEVFEAWLGEYEESPASAQPSPRRAILSVLAAAAALMLLLWVAWHWAESRLDSFDVHRLAEEETLESIAGAIRSYAQRAKELPPDLETLTRAQDGSPPLLRMLPRDRWGRLYTYRILSPVAFELRSLGRDGEADTDDDIVLRRGD